MYSIPYLILSKQYETVIDNCKDFKELLRTQRDTLNAQYLTILNKEVQAYLGLNRYKEAAEIRETIIAITDSINSNEKCCIRIERDVRCFRKRRIHRRASLTAKNKECFTLLFGVYCSADPVYTLAFVAFQPYNRV